MNHFIKFLGDVIKGQTKALKMSMVRHFFHKLKKISFVGKTLMNPCQKA